VGVADEPHILDGFAERQRVFHPAVEPVSRGSDPVGEGAWKHRRPSADFILGAGVLRPMRLGQFGTSASERLWCGVVVDDDTVVDLPSAGNAAGIDVPRRLSSLLERWNWAEKASMTVAYATETETGLVSRDDCRRHAPVTDPGKVVCVGLNYEDHARELDLSIPDEPVLFSKFPTAVVGPGDDVAWDPAYTTQVDYEAELVGVVGREARDVPVADAREHLAGVTVGNDVTARDLQERDGQWVRGKSLDTFAPIGPELVTLDEVGDPHDLDIWAEVDGERLQESTTANFIFGLDELVAACSRAFTLHPGDLIFTGTPPGVGASRDPPIHLDDGDRVTVGVDGVGELTNVCRHR
jgi:2-keto-4-pentenoate hydratase/2-oxohepta-3-ene-1,7-dioic acid hydratase in catechol pathway